MLLDILLLALALFLLIKSANFAIRYSTYLAEGLQVPKYIIGFVIIAVISILPEAFISITAAIQNVPSFGLGTLFGSNVADLTLIFALVIIFSGNNLKIESKIIKNKLLHIGVLLVPIILGLNGYYSRIDGIILIAVGIFFYYRIFKSNVYTTEAARKTFKVKHLIFLLLSMAGLLLGAHLTVNYGVDLAESLHVRPILIGMLVVGLGTTLPELFFSIKAAKRRHDGMALGDILGTVIADATVLVGVMALINPFAFRPRIIYVTGLFTVTAAVILFYFMKSGKKIDRKEACMLIAFYIIFVLTEFLINRYY